MYNYLRPIDERFKINNVPMPKPHSFRTNSKWVCDSDSGRDVNTGKLIATPKFILHETVWKYKLLRDDQFDLIYRHYHSDNKDMYEKPFCTIDSKTFKQLSYVTYEADNFKSPEFTSVQEDGHRYYKDVEFTFTNVGGDV